MKAVFDEHCAAWSPNIESNILYVRSIQNYLNDVLKIVGYVSIMDVFCRLGLMLDLDRLKSTKFEDCCWVYKNGDYIDFGMKPDAEKNVIYLDFNINID